MIDPKILNILESNQLDPSYSILIETFNQPEVCNREELAITVHQINPNVFDIITKKSEIINTLRNLLTENDIAIPDQYDLNINNIVEKTFVISSTLNYDQSTSMFTSGLNGSISSEKNKENPSQSLEGEIRNNRIIFTSKDEPNILDSHHFTVGRNQIVIDLTNDIESINLKITHDNITSSYQGKSDIIHFHPIYINEIINGQVIINIENIKNTLLTSEDMLAFDNLIAEKTTEKQEIEDSGSHSAATQTQIAELEAEINELTGRKEAAIDKINALTFTATKPYYLELNYTCYDDITSKTIECINFDLTPEITIDFMNTYKSLPGLILTIDKENKIYSSYDTIFTKNISDQYTGVTIIFNNLKRIRQPIEVNAIIIGDEIVQTDGS